LEEGIKRIDRNRFQGDPVLSEIVHRLVEAFQAERIYLFGSKARLEENRNSDYDLMRVILDDAPPEKRRSRLAYQVLQGTRVAAVVLVWTHQAFESRLHIKASLPATVIREGILLYAS
jgi:predicted nucleotidyltransferase